MTAFSRIARHLELSPLLLSLSIIAALVGLIDFASELWLGAYCTALLIAGPLFVARLTQTRFAWSLCAAVTTLIIYIALFMLLDARKQHRIFQLEDGDFSGIAFNEWRDSTFEVRSLAVNSGEILSFDAVLSNPGHFSRAEIRPVGLVRFSVSLREASDLTPKIGCRYRAKVRLREPGGYENPGSFDYSSYLKRQGISLVARAKGLTELAVTACQSSFVARVRQFYYHKLGSLQAFSEHQSLLGIAQALLLGEKAGIGKTDRLLMQRSGVAHLVAISGLHVGLIFLLARSGTLFLLRRVGRLLAVRAARGQQALENVALFIALLAAACYAAVAGLPPSAQRALAFLVLYASLSLTGFRPALPSIIALTFCCMTLVQPGLFYDPGFWLSFFAVACIAYFLKVHKRTCGWLGKLRAYLCFQLLMSASLLLGAAGFSSTLLVSSVIANAIGIPLVSFITVPAIFALSLLLALADLLPSILGSAIGWLAEACGYIAVFSLQALMALLSALDLSALRVDFNGPLRPVLGAITMVVLLALFYPARNRAVLIALSALIVVGQAVSEAGLARAKRLAVLDVGQGLAVVLEDGRNAWAFDTGPRYSDRVDTGLTVLLPYLKRTQKSLAGIVISHWDRDHAGGLPALSAAFPEAPIYAPPDPRRERYEISEQAPKYSCEALEERFSNRAVRVQMLWPSLALDNPSPTSRQYSEEGALKQTPSKAIKASANNRSCVFLIKTAGTSILFTGDIDDDVEQVLLNDARLPSEIDVLIAAHHGSASSSSSAFIDRVRPRYVVFSAGRYNVYGHPNRSVVERFEERGAIVHSTAEDGAFVFKL